MAKNDFSISDDMMFCGFETFLAAKVKCNVVINATMDQHHYATAIPLLIAGYNLLIEKPITAHKNELLEIETVTNERNLKFPNTEIEKIKCIIKVSLPKKTNKG